MSLVYSPINGYAGSITAKLYDIQSQQYTSDSPISLNIIEFSESDIQSEFNSEFTNILGDIKKDHYGYHKTITFSLLNSASGVGAPIGINNLTNVIRLIYWINICNAMPGYYRLTIQYRSGTTSASIFDAIYIGDFSLEEISAKSNSGQKIQLTFKEKSYHQLTFDVTDTSTLTILQDEESTEEERIMLVDESFTSENNVIFIQ